ncbi:MULTISPECIES: D-hexose-6-phosphate mutarotase [unclassified Variovorax]|uniref:D-hexose-6-phosphate mutarotase n=1 Tax=unclassified Variovorax TaxID=663243 RepID=UPI002B229DD7|nr:MULTISPECIES: D-hexose-6-phosphate mutarotase [unclassified Variovorax]MEB0055214.1 D-hexose-6-phosphate mutarotase [Variovorax sp. LG9.2]MEB0110111.1 D-hexose-6-phosphate mutarotase [Variovorax sp. RTB1]
MPTQSLLFRGQPALAVALPGGDRAVVALHGAHLLSWTTADGIERIYLSPAAQFDGKSAIRGGVPVCWPQFNERGPLPKHGFARNVLWEAVTEVPETKAGELTLVLRDNDATRALWPRTFDLRLGISLTPGSLRTTLVAINTDSAPWSFAAALHSYLHVDDIADARLEGLQNAKRWDSVRNERHVEMTESLNFDAEFDSVYGAPVAPLKLVQPSGTLQIAQSASCTETVVWNPGAALSAKMSDMPDDGYRHMLCVEAARIDENVLLAPGAQWQCWQQFTVL